MALDLFNKYGAIEYAKNVALENVASAKKYLKYCLILKVNRCFLTLQILYLKGILKFIWDFKSYFFFFD